MTTEALLNIPETTVLCPECEVDWTVIEETLAEKGSANEALAYYTVKNCPKCRERFPEVK